MQHRGLVAPGNRLLHLDTRSLVVGRDILGTAAAVAAAVGTPVSIFIFCTLAFQKLIKLGKV